MHKDNELDGLDATKGAAGNLLALGVLALIGVAGLAFVLWQMPD
jgi:hypothetical protein